jgi:hypothetical protein
VVVGCSKPRYFTDRSNLFEVHTVVSRQLMPAVLYCILSVLPCQQAAAAAFACG